MLEFQRVADWCADIAELREELADVLDWDTAQFPCKPPKVACKEIERQYTDEPASHLCTATPCEAPKMLRIQVMRERPDCLLIMSL